MRFSPDLRIREVELARCLSRRVRVVAVDRTKARGWGDARLKSKVLLRWDLARSRWDSRQENGVTRVSMPVVMATGPVLNRVAAAANNHIISKALTRFGCNHVFHSNPHFFMPPDRKLRGYRCHFDLVDNFFDEWSDSATGQSRKRFLWDAMLRADSLSAISHNLCDRVEQVIGRRPAYVPNGAALDQLRAWPAERTEAVRSRLGLRGRVTLAYIGNHFADTDGMEMLIEAFTNARKERSELSLLLVGSGSERVAARLGLGEDDGIHVIGPVPASEVWDYFHAADLGVLPFVLRPVTHDALPLKVIEFGGAGKPMLTTPLKELQRIALPHVKFAPYDSGAWTEALLDARTFEKPDATVLSAALRLYSWEAATDALTKAMDL